MGPNSDFWFRHSFGLRHSSFGFHTCWLRFCPRLQAIDLPCVRHCVPRNSRYGEAMIIAKKLLHTRYRVDDLDRTVKFYKDVLGLEEISRRKSPRGSELSFLKAPGSEELIELCCFPPSGPVKVQPDLTHLAFEVDSLEAFGKHLAKLGMAYSDGPHFKPDGGGIAFIDAPEGYEIELIQRAQSGRDY